jgi:hypothetical protein
MIMFLSLQAGQLSLPSGFLLAVEDVVVLESVPYLIWFHSTIPIVQEPFHSLGYEMNPNVVLSQASLSAPNFTHFAVNEIASRPRPFLGSKGPPFTKFLSSELKGWVTLCDGPPPRWEN